MNVLTVILLVACTALIFLQVRLRSSVHRLIDALRHPEDARPKFEDSSLFTPSALRELAAEIDRQLVERRASASRESEQQMLIESILDQFDDGFLIISENLDIHFANTSAREIFAEGREIENRQVIEAFFDHRYVETIREALNRKAKFSRTIRLEQRTERKGETMERFVTVIAAPLPYPLAGVDGAWVILHDESERFHLEQIRRDFVANASHEIRTPLTIISGYLETLSNGDVHDPDTAKRFYDVMRKHAKRLGRLVEDMLAISKLEGSPDALRFEVFDLAESVSDMVEQLQPLIQEKKAHVNIDFPDSDRGMLGDKLYWDQIFFNLIENALKQNDRQGLEIDVRLSSTDKEQIVQICDNGLGIPGNHLPHVFKRFYRVQKHHSQQTKGTGLGLSIVKRAVEAHRGTISVTSRPGIATVFTIRVPKLETPDAKDDLVLYSG